MQQLQEQSFSAGLRLFLAQKRQGTNLCIGLDPHFEFGSQWGEEFYTGFTTIQDPHLFDLVSTVGRLSSRSGNNIFRNPEKLAEFLCGVTRYYLCTVNAAWEAGIRVFKPQISFYEAFGPFGNAILMMIVHHIKELAAIQNEPVFILLDAKRGDIDSTQRRYYGAYLSDESDEVIPGMNGCYGFDSMTITTWMGEDVLTPGLPYFRKGKGATVVTRTSNPSGTTMQDIVIEPCGAPLSPKQEPYRFTDVLIQEIADLTGCSGYNITAWEVMAYFTEKFCQKHELNQDGVSPIFSVMGSTVKMDERFRKLRPSGVALVPGFGHQGGNFDNVMPLVITEGLHAGHVGLFASSRGHNFAWMKEYGGSGNPANMDSDLQRAIDTFRKNEKAAYQKAGLVYPY